MSTFFSFIIFVLFFVIIIYARRKIKEYKEYKEDQILENAFIDGYIQGDNEKTALIEEEIEILIDEGDIKIIDEGVVKDEEGGVKDNEIKDSTKNIDDIKNKIINHCSKYKNTDSNISIDCLEQLWKEAGCTQPALIDQFHREATYESVKDDYNTWATNTNKQYQKRCYGTVKTTEPTKPDDKKDKNDVLGVLDDYKYDAAGLVISIGIEAAAQKIGNKIASKSSSEAAEAAARKLAKETAEAAAQKAATELAEKAAKEAAEEVAEKATKEAAENAAKNAAKKATQQAAKEAAEKLAKEAAEKTAKEAAEAALKKATKESLEKAAQEAAAKIAQEAAEKIAKEATDKVTKEAAEKIAKAAKEATEKLAKEASEAALKKVASETAEKVAKESLEKASKEATEAALNKATKEAAERLATELAQKASKELAEASATKLAKEAQEKLAKESMKKILAKGIGGKVSQKMGAKLLFKSAKAQLKMGTRILMNLDSAASVAKLGMNVGKAIGKGFGNALKSLKPSPFIIFDLASILMDILDVGGYGKMGSKAQYYEQRDKINNQIKNAVEQASKEAKQKAIQDAEQEVKAATNPETKKAAELKLIDAKNSPEGKWPGIIGPLDKLEDKEINALILEQNTIIMEDPEHPLVKPMFDKLNKDIESGIATTEEMAKDGFIDTYLALIDTNKVYREAQFRVCKNKSGTNIDIDGELACSYSNKESCESSYAWDTKEGKPATEADVYAEFKTDAINGRPGCVTASFGLRSICEKNNLKYDSENGSCVIDEKYCKTKGADWRFDKDINEYDCGFNAGQYVAEAVFGTTITRGLKQVFDPAQYEPCNPGEIDDGLMCRKLLCKDDEVGEHGLCYKKCKPNYNSNGMTLCWQNCPRTGEIKIGGKCLDAGNMENGTQLTFNNCNGKDNQQFLFNTDNNTISMLKKPSKCIDVAGDVKNGKIHMWDCHDGNNQKWIYDLDTQQFKSVVNEEYVLDITNKEGFNNKKESFENKCNYQDDDNNLSNECRKQLWEGVGCITDKYPTDNWTFKKTKEEYKKYVDTNEDFYRRQCYNMSKDEYDNKIIQGNILSNTEIDEFNKLQSKQLDRPLESEINNAINTALNTNFIPDLTLSEQRKLIKEKKDEEKRKLEVIKQNLQAYNEENIQNGSKLVLKYNKKLIKTQKIPVTKITEKDNWWGGEYNKLIKEKKIENRDIKDKIGYHNNQWYIDQTPTCVGAGGADENCDNTQYVCVGQNGRKYGGGMEQLQAVIKIFADGGGVHAKCPKKIDTQKISMEQTFNTGMTCTKSTPSRVADCPPGYTNQGAHCQRATPKDDNRPADCFTIFDGPIKHSSGKFIDLSGSSTNNGTKIQLWDNGGGHHFYLDNSEDLIRPKIDKNKKIDIFNGNVSVGTKVHLWEGGGDDHKFTYDPYQKVFRSKKNMDLVLAPRDGRTDNGTELILVKYIEGDNSQKFDFNKNEDDSWTNNGANCGIGARSKTSNLGMGPYESAECPYGTTNTGGSCLGSFGRGGGRDDVFYDGWKKCAEEDGGGDRNNCEKWGARVYPKCEYLARQKGYENPENWTNDACCMCSPSIRDIKKVGRCPPQRGYNNDEKEKLKHYTNRTGGLCYVECDKTYGPGYYNNGTSCWRDAKANFGFSDMKCLADEFKAGARCYKNCPEGGNNTGFGTCTTGMSKMRCNEDEFKTLARCYKNPPKGFKNMGEFLNFNRSQYDRGVGRIDFWTYPKKRIIPFSTANN